MDRDKKEETVVDVMEDGCLFDASHRSPGQRPACCFDEDAIRKMA
jgi:hypothetical protein